VGTKKAKGRKGKDDFIGARIRIDDFRLAIDYLKSGDIFLKSSFINYKSPINKHLSGPFVSSQKVRAILEKIPLNPPLQKGEAVGIPGLIEMLRSFL